MERRPVNSESSTRPKPPPFGQVGAPVRATARPPAAEPADIVGRGKRRDGLRTFLAALGLWLFASAFLWPHGEAAFANSVVVGALLAACGLFAHRPMARLACGALGAWLALSTLSIVPRVEVSFWHNLIVGIVALVAAFVPAGRRTEA